MRTVKILPPLCLVFLVSPALTAEPEAAQSANDDSAPVQAERLNTIAPGNPARLGYPGEALEFPAPGPTQRDPLGIAQGARYGEGTINPLTMSEPMTPLGPAIPTAGGGVQFDVRTFVDYFSRFQSPVQQAPR